MYIFSCFFLTRYKRFEKIKKKNNLLKAPTKWKLPPENSELRNDCSNYFNIIFNTYKNMKNKNNKPL